MAAAEGRQDAELHPAGEQLAAGVAVEAANVGADKRHARQAHVHELRHRQLQVLPPGAVVAHPAGAPALHASEARARQHERPLVVEVSPQPFVRGAGHAIAVKVMYLGMGRSLAFRTLYGIEIDRPDQATALAERTPEHRWLVHIVPGAANAHIHKRLLHVPPPLTYIRPRVIGEDRVIGPDVAMEYRAVGPADEHVALHPCPVDPVIGIDLHAGIDDRHDAEAIAVQIGEQRLRIGEAPRVPCKDAIAVHVVDVQVYGIARDVARAKLGRQLAHHRLRRIAPAALVVAQRPPRRQRHRPQQRAEALAHLLRRRPVDHVVVELAALGLHQPGAGLPRSNIEATAPGVIEEDAVGQTGPECQEDWDGEVKRVGARAVAMGRIGRPVDHLATELVELPGALTEAEKVLADLDALGTGNPAWPRGGLAPLHTRVIGAERLPLRIGKGEASAVALDLHREQGRSQHERLARLLDRERCLWELIVRWHDRPGVARRERPIRRQPHPDQAICQGCNRDTWAPVIQDE
ncbi:MAG TPA: hypothetical protein VF026_04560 [Ktedonobacteraceae bacterium]